MIIFQYFRTYKFHVLHIVFDRAVDSWSYRLKWSFYTVRKIKIKWALEKLNKRKQELFLMNIKCAILNTLLILWSFKLYDTYIHRIDH
jgi:hypothetical protein